ncbi:conserved hypothetical protein [Neorickettsia sennetsu str. Miyayama]|uniref:Uncharacterized protein n=1 Tax=Ehrlichia sennetsu (strain ATCC VR-367 / Miyayama) TaxID=222891 RepID=Q2GCG1_EHRS3|nr:conserved hypothetical protein [Neorickettsia sennetsu str. Miyayama]
MKRLLKIIFFLLLLFISSLSLAVYLKNSDKENKYELQLNNRNNIFVSIGYYIVKPIIELYIDSRLDNYGLFDGIRSRLFYDRLITKSLLKAGEGNEIKCGDKVKINAYGGTIGKLEQLEYIVGKNHLPILNMIPIGMKKGEEAQIGVPGSIVNEVFLDKKNNDFTSFKVEILDVENKNVPDFELNPIILNGRITNKKPKFCGDNAHINYEIYDIRGNKIISKRIEIKIGSGLSPIENFVIDMQPLTRKIVIANGSFLDKKLDDELKILVIELIE